MRRQKQQRRNKGEGSVTVMPNGKYKMTITIGIGLDGKQKRKSVTGSTRQEVLQKATELRHKYNSGEYSTKISNISFGEYKQKWLDDKSLSVALNTLMSYRVSLNAFAQMDFIAMSKITASMINMQLKKLPLAKSSLKVARTILSSLFNAAVRDGTISKSPMIGTISIAKERKKVDSQLPTEEQINALLEEARSNLRRGDFLYAFLLLAVTTGLRRGELLGLKWSDINEKDNKISVNRQVTNAGRDKPLKTNTSYRTLHVPPKALQAVCALKGESKSDYVFDCGIANCASWLSYFALTTKAMMKKLQFPEGCSLHSLRHYHATYLLTNGINIKIVSKRLGHSSIVITLDNYAHWVPSMDEEASRIFDDFGAY